MDNYRFSICSIYTTFPVKKNPNSFHAVHILLEDLFDLEHHFYPFLSAGYNYSETRNIKHLKRTLYPCLTGSLLSDMGM